MSVIIPDLATQIESDHVRLHGMMSSMSEFLEQDLDPKHFLRWKVESLFQLRDFHNQLAKHFDLEELGGFFTEVLRLSPESANRIERLMADHSEILVVLERRIAELRSAEGPFPDTQDVLRRDLQTIIQRLKGHEALETELLYAAHYQVYGAGD
jgi:hypothetical protein